MIYQKNGLSDLERNIFPEFYIYIYLEDLPHLSGHQNDIMNIGDT